MDNKRLLSKEELGKIVKFAITGIINTVVDMGIFGLLRVGVSASLELSQTLGYTAGVVCSYSINRRWTFSTDERFFSKAMIRFLAVSLCCMGLSVVMIRFLAYQGLHDFVSKLATTAVIMGISFLANRLWVFRDNKGENDGEGTDEDNRAEQKSEA